MTIALNGITGITTPSDVTITSSGGGNFVIQPPNSATDRTLTLPDEAGTVLTSASAITQNSGPAFSATKGGNQSISQNTWTKITYPTENFDTSSCYDTSTSRFTPNVAGYYQVNVLTYTNWVTSSGGVHYVAVYKNGSAYSIMGIAASGIWGPFGNSILVDMNGSTDYLEVYVYLSSSGPLVSGDTTRNLFSAFLARAI